MCEQSLGLRGSLAAHSGAAARDKCPQDCPAGAEAGKNQATRLAQLTSQGGREKVQRCLGNFPWRIFYSEINPKGFVLNNHLRNCRCGKNYPRLFFSFVIPLKHVFFLGGGKVGTGFLYVRSWLCPVDQAGLELGDGAASSSSVLGLKALPCSGFKQLKRTRILGAQSLLALHLPWSRRSPLV